MKPSLLTAVKVPALVLAAALPLLTSQAALAADESPDLVVEASKVSPQSVELKVTNKSEWWADETKMVVHAVGQQTTPAGPLPHEQARTFDIENLDPGQSTTVTFGLAVPCLNHNLTVNVLPAANYEGVKELNQKNNQIAVSMCASPVAAPAQPEIDVDQLLDYGGCACASNDEPKEKPRASQEKAVSLRPIGGRYVYTGSAGHIFAGTDVVIKELESPRYGGLVGWDQSIGTGITSYGVRFSNGFTDWGQFRITSGFLTYTELEQTWQSGSGARQEKPGCVERIFSTPTIDVTAGEFQTTQINTPVNPAARRIDLSDYLRAQTANRGSAPNLNFVLRGALDSVDGDDETSCLSSLYDAVLDLKFEPR